MLIGRVTFPHAVAKWNHGVPDDFLRDTPDFLDIDWSLEGPMSDTTTNNDD